MMLFNADKCKVMHLGYNNTEADYKIYDKNLDVIKKERDLGIIIH